MNNNDNDENIFKPYFEEGYLQQDEIRIKAKKNIQNMLKFYILMILLILSAVLIKCTAQNLFFTSDHYGQIVQDTAAHEIQSDMHMILHLPTTSLDSTYCLQADQIDKMMHDQYTCMIIRSNQFIEQFSKKIETFDDDQQKTIIELLSKYALMQRDYSLYLVLYRIQNGLDIEDLSTCFHKV